MQKPLISVIMGVYNCKNLELLEKSVNSIINQTYSNWELIICNDGSTDNTTDILDKISQLDNRIRVIGYEKNVGLNNALNKCIENSNGDYIARQDDDDISCPERLQKEIEFLLEHPEYDMVGTIAAVCDDNGKWGDWSLPQIPEKKDFLWNSPFMHPTILVRKDSLIKAYGYRIAKETRRCEDYDLFMRMYTLGMHGYNIQEQLYRYRMINDPNKTYRPMKYRVDEAKVRWIGYKSMGILLKGLPYVLKPILIGLIPSKIFAKIRGKQY